MKARIELISKDAKPPVRATLNAAAYDCFANTIESLGNGYFKYGLGFKIHMPAELMALLLPRSSVYKTGAVLANSIGLIDSDYRKEVCALFRSQDGLPPYTLDERCCQIMTLPIGPSIVGCDEGNGTRVGGFGSTGG